jgi:hypothetical protein
VAPLAALAGEELDGVREHRQKDLERLPNGTRRAREVHDER